MPPTTVPLPHRGRGEGQARSAWRGEGIARVSGLYSAYTTGRGRAAGRQLPPHQQIIWRDLLSASIPPGAAPRSELTVRGLILGAAITFVFTAANVFFGLKAGLTFTSSIPAAV